MPRSGYSALHGVNPNFFLKVSFWCVCKYLLKINSTLNKLLYVTIFSIGPIPFAIEQTCLVTAQPSPATNKLKCLRWMTVILKQTENALIFALGKLKSNKGQFLCKEENISPSGQSPPLLLLWHSLQKCTLLKVEVDHKTGQALHLNLLGCQGFCDLVPHKPTSFHSGPFNTHLGLKS